jgi:hypothetical protein
MSGNVHWLQFPPICRHCGQPIAEGHEGLTEQAHAICDARHMLRSWRQWKLELKVQRIAEDIRILDERRERRRARQRAKVRS